MRIAAGARLRRLRSGLRGSRGPQYSCASASRTGLMLNLNCSPIGVAGRRTFMGRSKGTGLCGEVPFGDAV